MDGETDELATLIDRLLDDDEDARYEVARQIDRMGKPVLARVMALADDTRPRMREMACYILGQIGDVHPSGKWVTKTRMCATGPPSASTRETTTRLKCAAASGRRSMIPARTCARRPLQGWRNSVTARSSHD